ncbi:MAG: hypothetical protein H8E55_49485 [Pelagibacterales bacterium]|nr:hypothetical protein [Pelagibacterales bacterium]
MYRISHELPINMLDRSYEINDYEYCLPHLLDQSKIYQNHFYQAKKEGRYIIMDNSLHELGEAYGEDRLIYWMNELEPDEFIVPDVWMNKSSTLVNAKKWRNITVPKNTTKVAVVQAQSYGDAYECYNILKTHLQYKKIAFSYGADWYADEFPHPNPLVGKMMGRILTISRMYKNKLIEDGDRVHLLGCALPQEFGYYADMPFIETIDTSNPVIHGLEGVKYNSLGLLDKSSTKIDQIEKEITTETLYNINHNLIRFKNFTQDGNTQLY